MLPSATPWYGLAGRTLRGKDQPHMDPNRQGPPKDRVNTEEAKTQGPRLSLGVDMDAGASLSLLQG